jgi:hypothetical protein
MNTKRQQAVAYPTPMTDRPRGRTALAGACVAAAMYFGLAVGEPGLWREAPPDT